MRRFICSCLLMLALAGPTLPQSAWAQDDDQPQGTISIDDSATRDAAIATRIREILAQLDGYEDVTVTVSAGIVTLRGTTLDGPAAARLTALAGRVEGVVAIENEVTETTDVAKRLNPAAQRFMKRMQQVVAFLPLAGVALGAFAAVVLAGFALARLRWPWDRLAPNAFIADIYRQVIRLGFFVAGLVVALDILGATALLSTILGAAGIIGLAIGFAVRDTVENFIASIMLSIRQPFRPNDTVEIGGDVGNVIRLTSRATILLSFDGNHIRIPNATVFKSRIINFTLNDERRFTADFGVAYDTDLLQAQKLARETLEALSFVLEKPAVNVWIEDLGDSAVTLRCTAWIAQHNTSFVAARSEAIRLVMAAFDTAGIVMPEPTVRVLRPDAAEAAEPAAQGAPPRSPRAGSATAIAAGAIDVAADMEHELEAIVEDERQTARGKDLLRREGPTE
ncbi:BON domain-containing protein [Thalassococcus profundi]|uniref:Small-conductance mechanosensitive channel n=2 Tax=Thalassococcus profundi TaxID=2282382 RepID=A0A369TN06_9RHOB|nr:BON domain-containing protein [Thalassococcus profundi]